MKTLSNLLLIVTLLAATNALANGPNRGQHGGQPQFRQQPQYRQPQFQPQYRPHQPQFQPQHRPPQFRPPQFQGQFHQPRPFAPPVLPHPAQQWHNQGQWPGQWHGHHPHRHPRPHYPRPGYPVFPGHPTPAPLPPPIEQAYFPAHIYVDEPCDIYAYPPPVVETIPGQSFYCPGDYGSACGQGAFLPYGGVRARPVMLNQTLNGPCRVHPTHDGQTFLLVVNGRHTLFAGDEEALGFRYDQYVRMGTCR